MLRALMGEMDNRPILDVIPVPPARVDEVLQLLDDTHAAGNTNPLRTRWRAWSRIQELFPALRGKDVRVNTSNILNPLFEVVGDNDVPKVGRKYRQVFVVPADQIYRTIELVDESHAQGTLSSRYRLWKHLQVLFPDIVRDEAFELKFGVAEWMAVVQRFTDDE